MGYRYLKPKAFFRLRLLSGRLSAPVHNHDDAKNIYREAARTQRAAEPFCKSLPQRRQLLSELVGCFLVAFNLPFNQDVTGLGEAPPFCSRLHCEHCDVCLLQPELVSHRSLDSSNDIGSPRITERSNESRG